MFINTNNQVNDKDKPKYEAKNARALRMIEFIDQFMRDAQEDEKAWLEMQVKFSVPQYAQFLNNLEQDNGRSV